LKVTVENWPALPKKVLEFGIQHVEYNDRGELQFFVTNDGEKFEFSHETFEQFKNAGLLRLGRRVPPSLQ